MIEQTKYELRLDLLRKMNILMGEWDGTADSAEDIILENEKNILELKQVEKYPSQSDLWMDNITEKQLFENIVEKQKKMIEQIRMQQKKLVNQSKQLNKKDEFIKNYVSIALAPMFIDKGL